MNIINSYLCQQITKGPSDKGSKGLGGQRTLIQSSVVGGPSRDGSSANKGRITEKRALGGLRLAEGRLDNIVSERSTGDALGDSWVLWAESGSSGEQCEETKKLHDDIYLI